MNNIVWFTLGLMITSPITVNKSTKPTGVQTKWTQRHTNRRYNASSTDTRYLLKAKQIHAAKTSRPMKLAHANNCAMALSKLFNFATVYQRPQNNHGTLPDSGIFYNMQHEQK
jgi:hypothetical protein